LVPVDFSNRYQRETFWYRLEIPTGTDGDQRHRLKYLVPKIEVEGSGFGVPVRKPVPKAFPDRYLRPLF